MDIKHILAFIGVFIGVNSCISRTEQTYCDFKKAVLNKEGVLYKEILFVQTEKKDILGYANAFDVRRELLNGKEFRNCNKDSLLDKILRGEYRFDCENSLAFDFFKLSIFITDSYENQSFKYFLSSFTKYKKTEQEYVVKHQLSQDEKMTVIYYLYLNGYYAKYDDYDNRYYVTKGLREPVMEVLDIKPD